MISFLQNVALFSNLSEEQIERIAEICVKKTIAQGTTLFREKDMGAMFYIVFSGSVKIYTTSSGGEEKIYSVCSQGESFGELSLIDGKPRSASAQTLEDSVMYTLDGEHFLNLLRSNFDITLCIMQELCLRLRDTNQHVNDLTFLDARTRVIKNLILLANKNGTRSGNTISIKMSLNYDELSRLAGVQKSTLMQVIRDLQEKQILTLSSSSFHLNLAKLK